MDLIVDRTPFVRSQRMRASEMRADVDAVVLHTRSHAAVHQYDPVTGLFEQSV